MKLGIFGGTFDPPHIGHLILAVEAKEQLGLERIYWVLTPSPPHKRNRPITAITDRIDMLQAAIGDNPDFELSRVDIERPPPHYAVDTVAIFRSMHGNDVLVYLMGGDSLRDLPKWHNPLAFLELIDQVAVLHRPKVRYSLEKLEIILPTITSKVILINAPRIDISSTSIRQRIASGMAFRYHLPPAVYQIIRQRGYYHQDSAF